MILRFILKIFVFGILFINPLYALKSKERDLLLFLYENGYRDEAVYGLTFTKEDLKDIRFKRTRDLTEAKFNQYMLLKDDLHAFCGKMDQFRLLHPEGDLGFVGQFFAFYKAETELVLPNKERKKVLDRIFKSASSEGQEGVHPKVTSVPGDFYKGLHYFSHDIVILDKVMEVWVKTKSPDEIKTILTTIIANVPVIVFDLPNEFPDPSLYFEKSAAVQVAPVRQQAGYPRRLFMAVMSGTKVGDKLYKGQMIRYKAKHNRMCWKCKHAVVKQYHKGHADSFAMVDKYRKSMRFYDLCKNKKFDFIPEVLFNEEKDDRAIILMKNVGGQLKDIRSKGNEDRIQSILNQVLLIFVAFEAEGITPEDIKANNFLMNASDHVFVIDYDNAVFTRGPRFKDFLRVLWGITFEEKGSRQHVRQLLEGVQVDQYLKKFGPILSRYIAPILEGKVRNFAELKEFLSYR